MGGDQLDAAATGAAGAATTAYVDQVVGDLQAQSASVEDLFVSHSREGVIPASGTTTIPLFVAPFPCRLTSVALVSFQVAWNIPTSDADWWLTRIRYTRQSVSTTAVNIATKTTRATAGTEPAGEAITASKPWTYATTLFSRAELLPGDTVSMVFAPRGAPTMIWGPVVITVGYAPS